MATLLRKILCLFLPAAALLFGFELLARTIPTSYRTKHHYLMAKSDRIEVLVLGSSHANFGINPRYFGRDAFNISNTSQCLQQDYNVLLRYLPACKKIRLVVVPISYFTLLSDLALSAEGWRCAYYPVYMGVNGDKSASAFELKNHSALFLWDGPIGVIRSSRSINSINLNEYGYQTPVKTGAAKIDMINDIAGKNRVEYHHKIMSKNLLNYNVSMLEKMAEVLRRKNIKMVLITTPVYKTYSDNISKDNYDIVNKAISSVSKKYSVPVFNYFYDKRFEISDFVDNDHLNELGSKKFSLILKDEVIDTML
jgi:hypothetical protein